MKPVSLAVLVLAFVVAVAWTLSSAVGVAGASESRMAFSPTSCVPDPVASAPGGDQEADDADVIGLPPGHPSIASELPPGHPPIELPPGHPPIRNALPPGHPPIPSGHDRGAPSGDLFGEPVLLTI